MSGSASCKDIQIDPDRLKWCPGDTVKVEDGGSVLGEGTYGTVYRGEMDGAAVAIKVIKAWKGKSNDRLSTKRTAAEEQHAREIRRLTELSFGHVVQCYGVSQSDESSDLHLVTECLDGGSLHQNLARAREADVEVSETSFLSIGLHIAKGLRHIQNRYIHGDLKPHNVLLNTGIIIDHDKGVGWFPSLMVAKVADFGMSRRLNSDQRRLAKSTVEFGDKAFGSWGYLAPELFKGAQGLDDDALKAVDIFAFGVLLYEMLSGMEPWAHEGVVNPMHLCWLVVREKRRPHWGTRIIKEEYRELVEKCWDDDSACRPTALELSDCFGRWLKEAQPRKDSNCSPVPGCGVGGECHGEGDCGHSLEPPIPGEVTGPFKRKNLVTGIKTRDREPEYAPRAESLEENASLCCAGKNDLDYTMSDVAVTRIVSKLLDSPEHLELEIPLSTKVLDEKDVTKGGDGILCKSMLVAFKKYNNKDAEGSGPETVQESTPDITVTSNPVQQVIRPSIVDILQAIQIPGGFARLRSWWQKGHAAAVASAIAQEENMALIAPMCGFIVELLQNMLASQEHVRGSGAAKIVRDLCTALGNAFRGGCRDRTTAERALPLTLSSIHAFKPDIHVCHAACYALANVLSVCNEVSDGCIRAEVADCISDVISINFHFQWRGGPHLACTTAAAARNFVWRNDANAGAFFVRRISEIAVLPSAAENLHASMLFFQRDPTVVDALLSAYRALAHSPSRRVTLIRIRSVSGIARVMERPGMMPHSSVLNKALATLRDIVGSTSSVAVPDELVLGFIEEGGVGCVLKIVMLGMQSRDLSVMEESLLSMACISRLDPRLLNAVVQTGGVVHITRAVFTCAESPREELTVRFVGILCDVVNVLSQHAAARSLMRQSGLGIPLETLVTTILVEENQSRPALQTVAQIQ